MKIAVCGLVKSENIGELFIARSLEQILMTEINQRAPDLNIEFVEVDLLGRNDTIVEATNSFQKRILNYYCYDERGVITEKIFLRLKQRALRSNRRMVKNLIARARNMIWRFGRNHKSRLNKYFEHKMTGADFIVVDGAGLLEYSYNEYHWPLSLLSEYAERKGLTIVYNAIGRAGAFDERDFGAKLLKKALQSRAVTYISARDNPAAVQACAGGQHEVKLLADAAFWMKETYATDVNIPREKIGIGLIRGNSLEGYGVSFGTKQWVQLFADIARELEERGHEYEFFTNGLPADTKLGKRVLKKLKLPEAYLVERPLDDYALHNTINRYSAIVTCRMHSSIAAFTMHIPSIVLSWNDKVEKLMEIVGYPERAIKFEQFNAKYIVERMESAIAEGVADEKLDRMKLLARESVKDYVDQILSASDP